ncbi:DUF4365 domain-containing protein [Pseudoalteromonas piscicida]|uniref:DUF4365 domain-containing protein n=1 Tax=Pseudoalteromonas piscicida TaxID=43662 RepID=A0AAQ2IRH8_PSEO7|nr:MULTISPECIES: DUF4365 domain-containing protein [Pseudoalteromonas]KJY89987.1 hypothetical protein TW75_08290 [Pseudoalteromonas piscicida]QZO14959.1 DUF4365 domain-containing protein [Pseudoalteromonas piscicida]TMN39280.1 DUF4365 domain-containing protein [Pseudoalteromonas piscicida]TMN40571.1 DUF4365 domain-containing protein [Pseudoalteromonas piscicida]TMN49878.1 DUF4365 domain-containing protein [Pseudoalteromonas piscicida]
MGERQFKGTPGESLVQYLANKDDILASPPQQDQFGWDLHLQFKSNTNSVFLDENESNYNVYVQVKEFDKAFEEYTGRNIKLSNIQHMVTSNAPCFVIYAQPTSDAIYLVHIDSEIIKEGLKKIREAQANHKRLNDTTMTINPHKYGAVKVGISGSLKKQLIEIIGNSPRRYVEEKIEYVKTVGYTAGSIEIKGKVSEQDLLAVELGIKDSVEIELLEYNHLRFNIPIPYPEKPAKVELLSNEHASSIGLSEDITPDNEKLLLCVNDDSLPLALSGKLRVSPNSSKYGLFAFDSDYFKLVISQNESSFVRITFHWDKLLSSLISIDELRHQLNIAFILFSKDEKKFGFASLDNLQCDRIINKSDGADRSDILELMSILDSFEQLMKVLSIRLSTAISAGHLFANRQRYETLLKILFGNEQGTLRLDNLKEVNSGASILLFVPLQIRVLENDYVLTLRIQGDVEVFDDKRYFCQGYLKQLLPPVMADKKSVRSLLKRIRNLLIQDKQSQHHIVINTTMEKELAALVESFYVRKE